MKKKKQRGELSQRPGVKVHLHEDCEVTEERLTRFAKASTGDQLLVLAELRRRSEDQAASLFPALIAVAISVFAILVSILPDTLRSPAADPAPISDPLVKWIVALIVMSVLALVVLIALLPMIRDGATENAIRARAAVWLAGFEREIAWRKAQPGRRGRVWRRHHRV